MEATVLNEKTLSVTVKIIIFNKFTLKSMAKLPPFPSQEPSNPFETIELISKTPTEDGVNLLWTGPTTEKVKYSIEVSRRGDDARPQVNHIQESLTGLNTAARLS